MAATCLHGLDLDVQICNECSDRSDLLREIRRLRADVEGLHERIGGLPCSAPDSCSGPEFADTATNVCSVCLFRAEVGR